ncbi:YadA-like family protein [Xenorhabdus indica]|uniref:YadA-like family protein n=1 Tax=Xenorhabdus indica TaxID=333964 RepID=UPI001FE9E830|nr:YadA-like family protein [Xenorhabdus indica]MBC8943622.1 adhesin [Xenorhabdus indica]
MFNMKTTPRKLAILSVLISSALLSETAAATASSSGTTFVQGAEKSSGGTSTTEEVYTRAQSDIELGKKANAADVYTKVEVDTTFATKDEVYTKDDADNKIKTVKDQLNANMKAEVNNTVLKGVETHVKAEVGAQTSKIQGELNTKISDETEKRISGDIKTLKSANDYTDQRFDTLQSYTDQKVNYLDNKIDRIEKRANAGVASVAAMSNIPYSNNTGFSLGLGLGQYRNGSAVALGIQDKLNENVSLRLSTSWNNSGSPVFGAGVGISW